MKRTHASISSPARTLINRLNRIGERPLMFDMDAAEAWDIDDELDFAISEFLMQQTMTEKGMNLC